MSVFRESLFSGRVALVTGGATGIGRGIAEALARHGADVAIVSRKAENLGPAAEQIAAATGRRCLPLIADVRQPEAVEAAVARTIQELGGLRHRRQQRRRQLPLPVGRPEPQRLRHGDRHRCQGDLERLPGRLSRPAQGPWRPDPQHQRHPALRRHSGATPRRRRQGGGRRPDPHPGRRVGTAGNPGQRDRPGARSATPKAPAASSPASGPSTSGPSSRPVASARSTISSSSRLFVLSEAGLNLNGAIVVSDGGLSLTGRFGLESAGLS